MRSLLVLVTIVVAGFAACGGDDTTPTTDAAGSGSGSGSGSGALCTGQLYDACNPNASNCMSPNICKSYGASAFSVCVPPQGQCTSGGCPNQGTATVTCNTMGFCKPAAPNADCTSP
jgi:hypothetical protein